jgi:hypothetical protein
MSLPVPHPLREFTLNAWSASIGATPKAAYARVPKKGRLVAVTCIQDGAVTGTAAIAVAINGGSAIASAALSVTGGAAGTLFRADVNTTDLADVNEDDVISLTPSGATGTVAGAFGLVIRT